MGYLSAVAGVLALVALASASLVDNSLDSDEERVVLLSPVLAPSQGSKSHSTIRARQFPILVLLAQRNPEYREPQAKSLERNPTPIYVQKLEDQKQLSPARVLNRQRRHPKKQYGYGGGGHQGGGSTCNSCGGGHGGGQSYAMASATATAHASSYGKK